MHLGVDEETGEILSAVVSTNHISDGEVLRDILAGSSDQIEQVSADAAYDQRQCDDAIPERKASAVMPPRQGAKIWQRANSNAERHHRDENLRRLRHLGRQAWQPERNYHRPSLVETTMFRFKTIFGSKLSSPNFGNQAVALFIKCAALNRMIQIAKPDSYEVDG